MVYTTDSDIVAKQRRAITAGVVNGSTYALCAGDGSQQNQMYGHETIALQGFKHLPDDLPSATINTAELVRSSIVSSQSRTRCS